MVFDRSMDKQHQQRHGGLALLCIMLSILIHIATVLILLNLPRESGKKSGRGDGVEEQPAPTTRHIRMLRTQPEPEKLRPFAKTSADEPQQKPTQADFEGQRHTVASGDDTAPERRSDAAIPTMQGEEKEEIVTFDQHQQDGPLEHEGKQETRPAPPQVQDAHAPQPEAPSIPPGQGQPNNREDHRTNLGEGQNANTPAATHTATIPTPTPDGDTLLQTRQDTAKPQPIPSPPSARRGRPDIMADTPHRPSRPHRRRIAVHDPSLADHAQPAGFRTRERRSRSTGRFVMGSKPSLNVAATPRGRYEAEIYRRIARIWYAKCNEHRGDIIPGSLVISLRIDKSGYLRNMELVSRHGAGVIQQSFTLGAIRQAALPPMPPNVAADVVGEVMELLIEFNFD